MQVFSLCPAAQESESTWLQAQIIFKHYFIYVYECTGLYLWVQACGGHQTELATCSYKATNMAAGNQTEFPWKCSKCSQSLSNLSVSIQAHTIVYPSANHSTWNLSSFWKSKEGYFTCVLINKAGLKIRMQSKTTRSRGVVVHTLAPGLKVIRDWICLKRERETKMSPALGILRL